MEHARGDNAEGSGLQFPAVELCKPHLNMGCSGDWVNGQVGHGAVAALALDGDLVLVTGGHSPASIQNGNHALGEGHAGHGMDHQSGVHLRILQNPCRQHILCSLQCFLAGLEHELDRALNFVLHALEQLCCAQHHSGMGVMAAGIHLAGILGTEFHICLLLYRQGIHIAGLLSTG